MGVFHDDGQAGKSGKGITHNASEVSTYVRTRNARHYAYLNYYIRPMLLSIDGRFRTNCNFSVTFRFFFTGKSRAYFPSNLMKHCRKLKITLRAVNVVVIVNLVVNICDVPRMCYIFCSNIKCTHFR